MVQLVGGTFDLDMSHFDIAGFGITEDDVVAMTDTEFTVDSVDDRSQIYTGTGFTDTNADDVPDSGTLTGWTQNFQSELFVDWQDFSMSWEDYWAYVASGDTPAFLEDLFGGKDTFASGSGNDKLFSFGGNDTVNGGKGKDVIDGGDGKDKLNGGAQRDSLTGGDGADSFVFGKTKDSGVGTSKHDTIADFSQAQDDRVDLHKIDADTTQGGDQAFHLNAIDGNFTNDPGELIFFDDGLGHTIVQGDLNGDAVADFEIQMDGVITLTVDDFLL